MTEISKDILHHLAHLARIELSSGEEEKLLRDLEKILGHFEELRSLDTTHVAPLAGGTEIFNAFREDDERENTNRAHGTELFPESEKGFLKVPPVFPASDE